MHWPHSWHYFRYHPHIHWSVLGVFSFAMAKLLSLALIGSLVVLPTTEALAASKTWTTQSDFQGTSTSTGKWTHSDTSTTVTPGSITLATQSSSWSNISSRFSGIDGDVVDLAQQSDDTSNLKFWLITSNFSAETGQVWKTTNGGSSWTKTYNFSGGYLYAIWAVSDTTVIIAGRNEATSNQGRIWRSTDSGATFSQVHAESSSGSALVDVHGVGSNLYTSYVKSTNSGATWSAYGEVGAGESFFSIDSSNIKHVQSNVIKGTTNGGNTWTVEENIVSSSFKQIVNPDGTNWFAIYSLSSSFGVHKKSGSDDWGSAYTGSEFSNESYLTISMVNSTNGRIAGGGGKIYKTTNGFTSISQETSGTTETISRMVVCATMDNCFAGAENGTVLQNAVTYKTSGNSTLEFKPTAGTNQNWQSATINTTANGQTISTQYSHDNATWKNNISDVQNSDTLYIKFNLSTSDTSKTPRVDSVVLNYTTAGSGGDTTAPTISNINTSNISKTGANVKWSTDESATHTIFYGTKSGNLSNTQSAGSGTQASGDL